MTEPDSDQSLLQRYADTRSESAFRTLVERHSGMILASARRRLSDPTLAEDVAQRVFIILARKAKTLKKHPALQAWLHTTTRLQSQSLLRAERRQERKRQTFMNAVPTIQESQVSTPELDETRPLLDEALDELNEKDRRLILLRFVEEASYTEISRRLGKTEVACRKRVSRVLEKLNHQLKSKGAAIPIALIGTALGAQLGKATAASTPPAISTAIAEAALTNLHSISTFTFILPTVETMAYGKTKAFMAATLLAAIPLSMQWHDNIRLQRELAQLKSQIPTNQYSANKARIPDTNASARQLPPALLTSSEPTESSADPGKMPAVPGLEGEGFVFPLPFEYLRSLGGNPIDETGKLSTQIIRLLRMKPEEVAKINTSLNDVRQTVSSHEKENLSVIEDSDEKQVFLVKAFPDAGKRLRDTLEETFQQALGPDRAAFLTKDFFGGQLERRLFGLFGERDRTFTFKPEDDGKIFISVAELNEFGTMSQSYSGAYDEVPIEYRHLFQAESNAETP